MSKNIPVIKIKDGVYAHELAKLLPSLQVGTKFTLKLKVGKRYRLRSFRLNYYDSRLCECCGPYTVLSFRNSARCINLDSHFGICYLTPAHCL